MTLQFWSGLQDSIIDTDFSKHEGDVWLTVKSVDLEVVTTLIRKARWPSAEEGLKSWPKGKLLLVLWGCLADRHSKTRKINSRSKLPFTSFRRLCPLRSRLLQLSKRYRRHPNKYVSKSERLACLESSADIGLRYYVLRDEMFQPIVPPVVQVLSAGGVPPSGWEVAKPA